MKTFVPLLLLAAALAAQSNRTACAVTGNTAERVRALPSMSDLSKSWGERMEPRRVLARQEPGNWPLQFALQEPILRGFHIMREWDDAIFFYRQLPDRALGQALEARLLAGLQRQRSRTLLDQALAAVPESPWAHLALVEWGGGQAAGRDPELAARHFEQVRRLCPELPRVFLYLEVVKDVDRFAAHLQRLRRILEDKKRSGELGESDLSLFRPAWTWEAVLAGAPGGNREDFEKTVRADLEAIRALRLYDAPEWFTTIRTGYDMTLRDKSSLAAFQNEVLRSAPRSQAAWWIEDERGRRTPGETLLKRVAVVMRERIPRYGEQAAVRFGLRSLLMDAAGSKEEFERAADLLLLIERRHPDLGMSSPPMQLLVAEQYARRKVRLDQVPALVEEGQRQAEYQEKYRLDSDTLPRVPNRFNSKEAAEQRAGFIMARHALATGQLHRARMLLTGLRQNASARPSNWNWHEYRELAKSAGLPRETEP